MIQIGSERKAGLTLLELMVVLTISMVLLSMTIPSMASQSRQVRFQGFVGEVTDQLILAKRHAFLTHRSVRVLSVEADGVYLVIQVLQDDGTWRDFTRIKYRKGIKMELPHRARPHPTRRGNLDKAFASTHKTAIIFTAEGSSSASLVFSDTDDRTMCAVIASRNGRIRVFTWWEPTLSWRKFF